MRGVPDRPIARSPDPSEAETTVKHATGRSVRNLTGHFPIGEVTFRAQKILARATTCASTGVLYRCDADCVRVVLTARAFSRRGAKAGRAGGVEKVKKSKRARISCSHTRTLEYVLVLPVF